jgi:hypothetical protein
VRLGGCQPPCMRKLTWDGMLLYGALAVVVPHMMSISVWNSGKSDGQNHENTVPN